MRFPFFWYFVLFPCFFFGPSSARSVRSRVSVCMGKLLPCGQRASFQLFVHSVVDALLFTPNTVPKTVFGGSKCLVLL